MQDFATGINKPRSLFEKVWDQHVVLARDEGPSLLYIDRHLIHEGSFHAFNQLRERGLKLRNPKQIFGVADHYVPTLSRQAKDSATPEIEDMITRFDQNMAWSGIPHFGLNSSQQGIVHVIGPEQGISLPGSTIVCSDSHTSTHGALGAIAFGIGQSESMHVMSTQTLWQTRPKSMQIILDGRPGTGVSGKDIILHIIAKLGSDGAVGFAIEYAGTAIPYLELDDRFTMCNMTIEAGARFGMFAPDQRVFDYLKGRPYAPSGPDWDNAVAAWRELASDPEAHYDRILHIDASEIAPTVTWGTSPDAALPIDACVPDPAEIPDFNARQSAQAALDYMGLKPGTLLEHITIDRIFIGSCTNSRLSDLLSAASVLKGKKAVIPGMIVPGSMAVKEAAESLGLDQIFIDSGLEWRLPGCSMCVGINGDLAQTGERVASTSNRNFVGRQGVGVRTHLVSPAMAAAAAITGHLTDVRALTKENIL
jgi:3-isopropylmalate/(R)-2-methylmalate dehydratase large subunit